MGLGDLGTCGAEEKGVRLLRSVLAARVGFQQLDRTVLTGQRTLGFRPGAREPARSGDGHGVSCRTPRSASPTRHTVHACVHDSQARFGHATPVRTCTTELVFPCAQQKKGHQVREWRRLFRLVRAGPSGTIGSNECPVQDGPLLVQETQGGDRRCYIRNGLRLENS